MIVLCTASGVRRGRWLLAADSCSSPSLDYCGEKILTCALTERNDDYAMTIAVSVSSISMRVFLHLFCYNVDSARMCSYIVIFFIY